MEKKGFSESDLNFMGALKKYDDLDIMDANTSKLVVFETSQIIIKEDPFESKEEANMRL